MIVPSYAIAYSALDAHPRPLVTIAEAVAFMRDAGEACDSGCVTMAIRDMQEGGSVWALHAGNREPRYALRSRLKFRRMMREPDPSPRGGPWAA